MRMEKTERNANSLGTKLTLGEKGKQERGGGRKNHTNNGTLGGKIDAIRSHFCDFAGVTPSPQTFSKMCNTESTKCLMGVAFFPVILVTMERGDYSQSLYREM